MQALCDQNLEAFHFTDLHSCGNLAPFIIQAARRLNIATLQNIILYEYLPAFLGEEVEGYEGYQSDLHPGISHVFQAAAFRYQTPRCKER